LKEKKTNKKIKPSKIMGKAVISSTITIILKHRAVRSQFLLKTRKKKKINKQMNSMRATRLLRNHNTSIIKSS